MAEQLLWNVTVRAVGGPQLGSTDKMMLDAYDKLAISVPKKGTPSNGNKVTVDIAPDKAKVVLLVVKPGQGVKNLTFTVGTNEIELDAPLVLLGKGAVSLLSDASTLKLTNNDTQGEAQIDILVGRKAV